MNDSNLVSDLSLVRCSFCKPEPRPAPFQPFISNSPAIHVLVFTFLVSNEEPIFGGTLDPLKRKRVFFLFHFARMQLTPYHVFSLNMSSSVFSGDYKCFHCLSSIPGVKRGEGGKVWMGTWKGKWVRLTGVAFAQHQRFSK